MNQVQPRHAAIALFEEVRSCVVERLTRHPASPSTRRYRVVHGLDLAGNRVAVFREVFANFSSRLIDTVAAHDATARMDPKAIFRVILREQCRTFNGIL